MKSINSVVVQNSPEKRLSLNRSASFSDMSFRKRIVIEECLVPSSPGRSLYRHYSCEQITYTPTRSKSEISILRHCMSEVYVSSDVKNREFSSIGKDVDRGGETKVKDLDFTSCQGSTNETEQEVNSLSYKVDANKKIKDLGFNLCKDHTNVRRQTISYSSSSSINTFKYCCLWVIISFMFICFGILAIQVVLYQKTCKMTFDLGAVKTIMDSKLFGQAASVKKIVSALETFYSSKKTGLEVFVITGSTGVGKSYAMSLLGKCFPWQNNIRHWVMPINSADMGLRTHNQFSSCGDNLVVIDSLSEKDVSDAIQLAKYLTIISEKKRILAFFIFNLKHKQLLEETIDLEGESSVLSNKFHKAGFNINMIVFQPLEEQHVILCIKEAMAMNGILLSKQGVDMVLESLNPLQEGCKRVVAKVALLPRNQKTDL